MKKKCACACEAFPCVLCIAGGGLVFGAIFWFVFHVQLNRFTTSGTTMMILSLWAIGAVTAYVLLAAFDILRQKLALKADPLPADVEVADRSVAGEQAAALSGKGPLPMYLRRLLQAWSLGASGPQVAAMARNQFQRADAVRSAEMAAMTLLTLISALPFFCARNYFFTQIPAQGLPGGYASFPFPFPFPGGLFVTGVVLAVLLPFIFLCRRQVSASNAAYIEGSLLARIGNDTPAGAMQDYAAQVSATASGATDSLAKASADSSAALAKSMTDAAAALAKAAADASATWAKASTEASGALTKAVADASGTLGKLQESSAAKLGELQTSAAKQLGETQANAAKQLAETQESVAKQLAESQGQVAQQLSRVTELAAQIDNVLKIQQTVDGTIKSVTTTEEFKSTLSELKRHLAESDELLKQVAKPRMIRLVEGEKA